MNFKDVFFFDKFLTPVVMNIVYWGGIVLLLIVPLMMFMDYETTFGTVLTVLGILVFWLIACVIWRLICEGIVLLFKMFERLTEIRDRLPAKSTPAKKVG